MPFSIAFDARDEDEVIALWRAVLRSNQWSHGANVDKLEQAWSDWNGIEAVAFDNWSGAALAALDFYDVRGKSVLCPSNTFLATPRSVLKSGADVVYYDCNREDLCGAYEDFARKAEVHKPAAAFLVHIGGHIAFDAQRIAAYCRDHGIVLIEDCAHAVGAEWNGMKPGQFGDVGLYSLYATKTISAGEGGVAVTANADLARHLRSYRDYGRGSRYVVQGLNHRLDEFRAALGLVQIRRMPEIVMWKQQYAANHLDPYYAKRIIMPPGMKSNYYKYIIFEPVNGSTGKVYEMPCHRIYRTGDDLPNTDWVADNHWCVPIYYPR